MREHMREYGETGVSEVGDKQHGLVPLLLRDSRKKEKRTELL